MTMLRAAGLDKRYLVHAETRRRGGVVALAWLPRVIIDYDLKALAGKAALLLRVSAPPREPIFFSGGI